MTMVRRSNVNRSALLGVTGAAQDDIDGFAELPPSIFPCLDARPGRGQSWQSVEVPFEDALSLTSYCHQNHVSSLAVLQAAWALVLRCYIGNASVCFASRTVERPAMSSKSSTESSADTICKVDIDGELSALELIKGTRTIKHRSHPQLEGLSPARQPETPEHLVNTMLLFQESEEQDWQGDDRQDPAEWADRGLVDVRTTSCTVNPII